MPAWGQKTAEDSILVSSLFEEVSTDYVAIKLDI